MKTKLLKRVRKRYSIEKIKVEDWMKTSEVYYHQCCFEYKNSDKCCFVSSDKRDGFGYRTRWHKTGESALDRIKSIIIKDYEDTSERRSLKIKKEKVWHV